MALITADTARSPLYSCTPSETIDDYKKAFKSWDRQHGHLFKDQEQSEYFYMLPLNKTQRLSILSILQEEQAFLNDLSKCDGSEFDGRTQAHRNVCLKCVLCKKIATLY